MLEEKIQRLFNKEILQKKMCKNIRENIWWASYVYVISEILT